MSWRVKARGPPQWQGGRRCSNTVVVVTYTVPGIVVVYTHLMGRCPGRPVKTRVLGGAFCFCIVLVLFIFSFLFFFNACRISFGEARPRCVSILPQAQGISLPLVGLRLLFVLFFGVLFLFFFFLLPFFVFLCLSFFCYLAMYILCLSYPVRWHGIALSTPFSALRCTW